MPLLLLAGETPVALGLQLLPYGLLPLLVTPPLVVPPKLELFPCAEELPLLAGAIPVAAGLL
ncbi:hypothetical protein RPO_06935 [Rickettsia rickettsii str. Arizona]|uniref:Uncharacterized protein n=1 Tax=Rickettsia rickettsii (strain Sheila Smith) TaxID=392021 RepID=A0A0H3AXU1_RICRS|nr:hypothetical protein A1G_06890 [Rickettsia rickettsii str. 'Sheila Smith']AFB21619.1 hypothetical protein RPN_00125 [Rickettsia rickettsii str. Brazil]AFB24162.1 hypothetical protein RPL_06920 [Rickettsia rickettsii str. Colombia]AFB25506.1 hypothetical protein RPO_06935 [Rickettsia rickettsii str. Arizona]AFB28185.1 hypothetical protein RPJ_06885 [Rickettsia rickettsii str. Hino]AFB29512.1 hypothetical protein RPK_06860 [Rickettsia rickettsii str. Hlp\